MSGQTTAATFIVVAAASAIRAHRGQLVVDGTAPVLGEDGVTLTTSQKDRTRMASSDNVIHDDMAVGDLPLADDADLSEVPFREIDTPSASVLSASAWRCRSPVSA